MRLGINGRFYRAAVTGVQRFAREITERLCEIADVTLLMPHGVEPAGVDGVAARHGRLSGHAWEQLELPGMARAAGCDVTLHLSGTGPFHGGPHVLVIHDVLPLTNPEWYSRRFARWYSAVLPRAARRAAAVITVSETSRREIIRVLGMPRRIAVVGQGLAPFDRPADPDLITRVRRTLDLERPFLLAARYGDPRKNHGFLLRVLDELERRDAPLELVIVGGVSGRVYRQQPLPDGPGVRWLGHVSDEQLRALYSSAVALCFPSFAEGFGRPPLEAAACGTPAVIADLDAVSEPGRSAGVSLPLDAAAWADAILRLQRDATFRAAAVERGRALGEGFDWDEAAARVLAVCESVARGRGAPDSALHASGV